jgi:hypothetical protein
MTAGTATTGYKRSKTVPGTRESGTPAAPSPCGATSDTPSVGSESPPRFMPCATRPCPGQHVQKQPRDARGARAAMGVAPRLSCRATMQRPLTPLVAPEKPCRPGHAPTRAKDTASCSERPAARSPGLAVGLGVTTQRRPAATAAVDPTHPHRARASAHTRPRSLPPQPPLLADRRAHQRDLHARSPRLHLTVTPARTTRCAARWRATAVATHSSPTTLTITFRQHDQLFAKEPRYRMSMAALARFDISLAVGKLTHPIWSVERPAFSNEA